MNNIITINLSPISFTKIDPIIIYKKFKTVKKALKYLKKKITSHSIFFYHHLFEFYKKYTDELELFKHIKQFTIYVIKIREVEKQKNKKRFIKKIKPLICQFTLNY